MKIGSWLRLGALALAVGLSLAWAGAASAQEFDARAIPRPPQGVKLYEDAASAIFNVREPVPAAAESVAKFLSANGWQNYGAALAMEAQMPDMKILSFKKGPQLLSVFVRAPASPDTATSVTYSALPRVHDLPFPADGADIKFDTTRPYLSCVTGMGIDPALAFFRTELGKLGWSPWSLKTRAKAENSDEKTEKSARAYYMNAEGKALSLSLLVQPSGKIAATLEPVPASLLKPKQPEAVAKTSPPPPAAAPAPPPEAAAIDDLARQMVSQAEKMAADAMKGAGKPALRAKSGSPGASEPALAAGPDVAPIPVPQDVRDVTYDEADGTLEYTTQASVKQIADFYRGALQAKGWKSLPSVIQNANMSVVALQKGDSEITVTAMKMGDAVKVTANGSGLVRSGGKAEAAATPETTDPASERVKLEDLTVEESGGLPVPNPTTSRGYEKTLFRVTATASLPASVDVIVAFYRRELPARGWREAVARAKIAKNAAELFFDTDAGPGMLTLTRSGGETSVALTQKKEREAKASGLMPAAGKARILFGNITEQSVVVEIGRKKVAVKGGVGSKKPDGPTLELPAGKYAYTIKGAGMPAASEELVLGANEIWGLMIGPGGGLALPAY